MTQDVTAGNADTAPVQLSLQDLQNLAAIVDTAVRRGAFQAAEASTVGAAFDRLNKFLTSAVAAQSANTPAAPSA